MRIAFSILLILLGTSGLLACTSPGDPSANGRSFPPDDSSLRIAALDYNIGDLSDPAELAKFTRADILIVATWQFWETSKDLADLRAANPDLLILAYFRTKALRRSWATPPVSGRRYTHDLYQAGLPYLARTTTGDTVSDWPGTYLFDCTDPAARAAMIDVFADYQRTSGEPFDGVFWDYFSPRLWISPLVTSMEGEPDLDGDGLAHWDDDDEQQAFVNAQDAWVDEMRRRMGGDFIQIANGTRAASDSTFAAKLDGMFYEMFPAQAYVGAAEFRQALDPAVPNNLWTARNWPRRRNGGPWLILSQMHDVGSYLAGDGTWQTVDADELTRAVALLTGNTAITYEGTGVRDAGIPDLEYDFGPPRGEATIVGDTYVRDFAGVRLELFMGSGNYPTPFDFLITRDGRVIQEMDFPSVPR